MRWPQFVEDPLGTAGLQIPMMYQMSVRVNTDLFLAPLFISCPVFECLNDVLNGDSFRLRNKLPCEQQEDGQEEGEQQERIHLYRFLKTNKKSLSHIEVRD